MMKLCMEMATPASLNYGLVAVYSHRGNVDHLALLDRDQLDPLPVNTTDGLAEGNHIVLLNDLLCTG